MARAAELRTRYGRCSSSEATQPAGSFQWRPPSTISRTYLGSGVRGAFAATGYHAALLASIA
jgi:hypothetical protein